MIHCKEELLCLPCRAVLYCAVPRHPVVCRAVPCENACMHACERPCVYACVIACTARLSP